jgi:hypothetical protein
MPPFASSSTAKNSSAGTAASSRFFGGFGELDGGFIDTGISPLTT